MRRNLFIFLCVCLFFVCKAIAHPPSNINIEFDSKTKILKAEIIHNTSSTTKHYINKVDIELNGKEVIEHKISRQDNSKTQTVMYLIPDVKKGDRITVEAYCSISGVLKKTVTVE